MNGRRWVWFLLTLVVIVSGCGGGSKTDPYGPNASSYFYLLKPNLVRWTTSTIPIEVDTTDVPLDWNPAYFGYVATAYERWLQDLPQVRTEFFIFPHDTDKPKVSVRWVTKIEDSSDPKAIALTKIQVDPSDTHRLTGFDVQIALCDTTGKRLSDQQVMVATVHEIGHTLGLMCHSPNEDDVMYAKAFNASPTERDLETLRELYNTVPVVTDLHALQLTRVSSNNK